MRCRTARFAAVVAAAALLACGTAGRERAQERPAAAARPDAGSVVALPGDAASLKLAVIGDSGSGGRAQYQVADQLIRRHAEFRFELVLMLGDNIYGNERPEDYDRKFARPYKVLLDAGVKFYASLGNHDEREQRFYKLFNMDGHLYYSFNGSKQSVRFFALDSTYLDRPQLAWLERELQRSGEDWKICFFHHPIYSSGERHGSHVLNREVLEPLFLKYGVSVVFAGHEHLYERLKPQKGISYFTSGAAGKLRRGNLRDNSELTAKGFDRDNSFMLLEIVKDELYFQSISRAGAVVDSGVIERRKMSSATGPAERFSENRAHRSPQADAVVLRSVLP